MPFQVEDIKFSISHITILCKEIPINIPNNSKRSKIQSVMSGKEEEDTWPTFDKYFDALFAETQQTCAHITMEHIC